MSPKALLGVLHETGHALYERGLPEAIARQPVGEAAGMAAHESQSLIVEMQACRSDAFLGFLGGELHAAFGGDARFLCRRRTSANSGGAWNAASSAWMPTRLPIPRMSSCASGWNGR
jgi:carboxypeptidase Taq